MKINLNVIGVYKFLTLRLNPEESLKHTIRHAVKLVF